MRDRGDNAGREPTIEELLDAAGTPEERRRLLRSLRRDPARARELAEVERLERHLRHESAAPDLADAVLNRVHRRRRFLPAPLRRVVTVGRVVVAFAVLATAGLVVIAERHVPEGVAPREPAPVSEVVTASRDELGAGVRNALEAAQRALAPGAEGAAELAADPAPRVWKLDFEGGPTMERSIRLGVNIAESVGAEPGRPLGAEPRRPLPRIIVADEAFGFRPALDPALGVDPTAQARVVGASPRSATMPMLMLPGQRDDVAAPAARALRVSPGDSPDVP